MPETRWGLRPGQPYPLGASISDGGTNFSVYSRAAERIELCLFDASGGNEQRIDLPARSGHVWHGFVPGISAGQLYGYRAHGAFEPEEGQRFNAAKLLTDPYAHALAGRFDWATMPPFHLEDGSPDVTDNAASVPRSVVCDDAFDWQGDAPPRTSWQDTVIYETHVRGFTMQHPQVPEALRGRFLGMASEATVGHLRRLGITAVELLPVTARANSRRLHELGLTDYWGYGPIAYFAPDAWFSSSGDRGGQVTEFKQMVRELHRNGIEVLLDVVYNHTAESDRTGPTLSYRGLDNATYYRLDPMDPAHYLNFTGTGNTLNLHERPVMRLVLDSLRYWVQEMHVDGFRFDLAASLARGNLDVDARCSFLDAVYQDPVLSQVKLIAEPWDLGPDGYQTGGFPAPWSEWNDRFRDDVRRYWRGDETPSSQIARRLTASPDLFATSERSPQASINYITSHDGFTLHDLVSYGTKHNLANGEENRDGTDDNLSQNFGVEGPTQDASILATREQQKRNLLATLLFSQGVPMLLGGDEMGRTQLGNNNAYNQDNATSWFDWRLDSTHQDLVEFTARLIDIRRRHPNLRRRDFLDGHLHVQTESSHVRWLREDGHQMTDGEWQAPWYHCFALYLDGKFDALDADGAPMHDDALLLILNAASTPVDFLLPDQAWSLVVDTARPEAAEDSEVYTGCAEYVIAAHSLALLRSPRS